MATRFVLFSMVLGLLAASWSTKESLAFQEANPQCEYGTNALNVDTGVIRVVPTFHSLSVYWSPSGLSLNKTALALFGEVGSTEDLRRSLDFVHSADEPEYRGSIVHLKSGTEYEITLVLDDVEQETVVVETWCEQFPVAETRFIPTGLQNEPFIISDVVGSPDGYIVYTADPDGSNVLDAADIANNIIIEDSAYVILRGLTLRNAQKDAIVLTRSDGSTHDIVIEDNIIENWGDKNDENGFGLNNYAITNDVAGKGTNFERLIIQRNIIRNPRWDTNSWQEFRSDGWRCTDPSKPCHPKGPGGLYLKQTAGNHVIRYNEIYSTNGNYYNDAIGGGWNYNLIGNVNKDTDIYGNILTHIWDDAIEAEGGNANVRIWGNYMDRTFVAIAVSPTARGPAYIFRNVVYRTQYSPRHGFSSGQFIKATTFDPSYLGAGVFVFHNTTYRNDGVGGVGHGITSWGRDLGHYTSRNNIIDARIYAFSAPSSSSDTADFDYDLYQGGINRLIGQEQYGIEAAAVYDPDRSAGFALGDGALGHDDGAAVPNFSDNAIGLPDMGAQERGAPPLEFGILAYPVPSGGGGGGSENAPPVADFSFSCVGLSCSFADRSTDADGMVVSWSWDLGDGNSATSQSSSHTYSLGGDYTVTLIVTDNDGAASASTAQTLTVTKLTGAGKTKVIKVRIKSDLHEQLESVAVEQETTIESLMVEAAREIVARNQ